ncbi:MAG TPA: methyltransferase domain-containing protein, partial [Chitinophagaceae bacterium]
MPDEASFFRDFETMKPSPVVASLSKLIRLNSVVHLAVFTKQDIARYYDLTETHYRRIWNLGSARSLHYGYWDDTTPDFYAALININRVLADTLSINSRHHVLDAGCGVGGSSIWLAADRKCRVTGITLNARQVELANQNARDAGVQELTGFYQRDYLASGFGDQSFDVVWAIESVCYANDKADFLREAFRLLKPGGAVIVADFFKKDKLDSSSSRAVQRMANGWAINDFCTSEYFLHSMRLIGFTAIKDEDITQRIMPSAKRLYRSYFPGVVAASIYRLLHPGATA